MRNAYKNSAYRLFAFSVEIQAHTIKEEFSMHSENLQKIILLRHLLHTYPELSLQEVHTRRTLMEFLRTHTGLEIHDRGRWFYARYTANQPNAPTIAFRADMDALPIPEGEDVPSDYASRHPGISHKCGHDGHCAALAGFALEVWQSRPPVNVCFIFQHAEEIGQGGAECAEALSSLGCGAVYAFHNLSGYPENSIVLREGLSQCASRGLTFHFRGRASHASQPEDGCSPAAAIARLVLFGQELPSSGGFSDLTLCTVVHIRMGDRDFGISPGDGEVSFTIRANQEADLELLDKLLTQKSAELAAQSKLSVEHTVTDPFPETRNHSGLVRLIQNAAKRLGKQVIHMAEPWRASEDFGYYTKKCPGAIFYIGNGVDYPPLHTVPYDFHDGILETAVDLFLALLQEQEKTARDAF